MRPQAAPNTTAHIFELATKGLYTGIEFFRVHKGFVVQTSSVAQRTLRTNEQQKVGAAGFGAHK